MTPEGRKFYSSLGLLRASSELGAHRSGSARWLGKSAVSPLTVIGFTWEAGASLMSSSPGGQYSGVVGWTPQKQAVCLGRSTCRNWGRREHAELLCPPGIKPELNQGSRAGRPPGPRAEWGRSGALGAPLNGHVLEILFTCLGLQNKLGSVSTGVGHFVKNQTVNTSAFADNTVTTIQFSLCSETAAVGLGQRWVYLCSNNAIYNNSGWAKWDFQTPDINTHTPLSLSPSLSPRLPHLPSLH